MSISLYEEQGSIGELPHALEVVDNSRFLFFIALAIDAMLFIAFTGGFLLLRGSAIAWPPADLPHLHRAMIGISSGALAIAALLLTLTVRAQNRNALRLMRATLVLSLGFLAVFLALNILEWKSLFADGLPIRTVFGGLYFVITGAFHLHIAGCMLYILSKYRWTLRWRRYTRSAVSIAHLAYFVCAMLVLWTGIYAVIYF